ncbi:sigma-54-dependent Fis family transcriptional regulator [Caproiciproducens sp. NJN-50]|uniref:sigma-54-dependent transcriptional regulator n=1 Tax=Acutalibacteraceae TaxID=3082771 RepID=UPI000FFE1987|nr:MULTISPECIES: sigma-54 dependent transcriptional regulator [Acutalibacteraceae]QAT48698.1 sigma-54-dependent Fis family transcriptional regulator [Caproiciproducens sp. NJN-50]
MKQLILVADDEPIICQMVQEELKSAGYDVLTAQNGQEAVDLINGNPVDLAILDVYMPVHSGFQCLQELRRKNPVMPIIMITAYATVENAVEAMKYGANDYIGKPFDCAELAEKVQRILRTNERKKSGKAISTELIGTSCQMAELRHKIKKVSCSNATVLITGESGTGKSAIAKEIHRTGTRSASPFVHVDCASLPESLMEDELFGHERGAYTGAIGQKKGKFEQAEDGDLFLDEIGTLPLPLQAKLLNVLQERYFFRIGGSERIEVHSRILAATNENLEEAVYSGRFRKDLYYRLNVVEIKCPPLRQHREDIRILAEYYFDVFWKRNRGEESLPSIDPEIYKAMEGYDWPGNVRELENVIESIAVLSEGDKIGLADLPVNYQQECHLGQGGKQGKERLSLKEQEIMLIIEALERNNGNRTNTAKELGISRRALQYRIKELNLLDP